MKSNNLLARKSCITKSFKLHSTYEINSEVRKNILINICCNKEIVAIA